MKKLSALLSVLLAVTLIAAPVGASAASRSITRNRAKTIALKHAGVKESKTRFLRAYKDYDDGRVYFEVDFKAGKYEYDYEISTKGKIISYDRDIDDDYVRRTTKKSSKNITASRAKTIALNHAGVKRSNAVLLRAEKDYEHGKLYYEVSFYSKGYEYDYEINARTGKIVSFDKDYDD
jgi:uncharacterized membrane protein YkoI